MKRALCLIREALVYRRASFMAGLRAASYRVVDRIDDPDAEDVVVMWNRYGANDATANRFERAGGRVVVAENGYLGKSWLGDRWFALALSQHAGGGRWFPAGPERWDRLNVLLAPWRKPVGQPLILAQRGIGSPSVRSPDGWAQRTQKRVGGRIRPHPGKTEPTVSLADDLVSSSCVVTWASSAAFAALLLGVPVWYEFPRWIGRGAGRALSEWGEESKRDDGARLEMFRDLAWAIWRVSEIEDGTAFKHLLRE